MDDERVDRLLCALPREVASPGFTAQVLARLDHLERVAAETRMKRVARIFGLPRLTLPAVVLAATLAVAASLSFQGGGMLTSSARPPLSPAGMTGRHGARAQLHSLGGLGTVGTPQMTATLANTGRTPSFRTTRQGRALLQEIREIRADHLRLHHEMRQSEARNAKIYLGGDEDADLVVHLDQIRDLPGRQDEPPPYRYD
jgi:hypothetical protein